MIATSSPVLPAGWTGFVDPILTAIEAQRSPIALLGLAGSGKSLVLSTLALSFSDKRRSMVVLASTEEAAEDLHADLVFFHKLFGASVDHILLFPEWGQLPYSSTRPPVEIVGTRMRALDQLAAKRSHLLITSVPAFLQRLLPQQTLREASLNLKSGSVIERTEFISRLLRLGYTRVSAVEAPGEFAVRGGIVDLFSSDQAAPYRIEFLGDTVETLRVFDPSTQKSAGRATELRVLPARELLREGPQALEPLGPDAEWRAPAVYPTMQTLLDYFPKPPVLVADEPLELQQQAETFLTEAASAYAGLDPSAEPLSPPSELFLPLNDLLEAGGAHCLVTIDAIGSAEDHASEASAVFRFETQRPQAIGIAVKGRPFAETIPHLEAIRSIGPVTIVARSRGQVDRLCSLFREHDLPAEPLRGKSVAAVGAHAPYALVEGDISGGLIKVTGTWNATLAPLAVITEDELFARGARHKSPTTSKGAAFLKSVEELKIGDYVVHVQHGIGRYVGLQRLPVQGFTSDYLIVEYAGGDKVYVPLDRLNQVQRYFGSGEHVPKLDRLGGKTWERTKSRVRKGIQDMAKDLIAVQAAREVGMRPPFTAESILSHEFDAAFQYEETEDQLRAIEDVRRDMETEKPMDRLVCGDVGYGKTEVAMRAAFKAVIDNKQAAVVVPTTLLAQQHFETFSERFAPFPVKVGVLSRFQTPKDQKATLRGLADGTLDIVIGTHRLLQKDVQFRQLGLLVIDEEQWFGVKHKERLKLLRAQLDVLTLTATPIPRTLQMAMSGLRELSVIETPPADRLAIRTQVARFGKTLIREAILRELSRGGQVFFVHNRVHSIEHTGAWLRELIPEARIVVAHGQMHSRLVEAVMLKFHSQEADVLLSTAIIESGLDIPNANTIFVDRADTFGLAQLYQLRGRVGRGSHQAYAYFLVPEQEILTGEAQKRLQAIQDFTALGSGFRIAAADMEIRGGGNLLGQEQSGHIGAVGFELYMQMLEEAVRELKGQAVVQEMEPALQLQVSAFIPDEYVDDVSQRLSLYKRLSSSRQPGDLAQLHGELLDRYGPVPDPVERLFEVMEVRLLAKTARAVSIQVSPGVIAFSFDPQLLPAQEAVRQLMDHYRSKLRFSSPHAFQLLGGDQAWKNVFQEIKRTLQVLGGYDKNPGNT
ncbi:MAG TPA: transcription-repair coupling factor [Nitrospirales bacterium]|jgi:transcription-repair coupling factor (superfamily II helicase)